MPRSDKCRVCDDNGWLIVTVFMSVHVPDGTRRIERCDLCQMMTDAQARKLPAARAALRAALKENKQPCES